MPFTKEDRRARRTRERLRQALAQLLCEKELAHITVREVTELADVNRSTFYLHYTDLHDLYQKTEDSVVQEITAIIEAYPQKPGAPSLMSVVSSVFDYVAQNVRLCTALLRTNDTAFIMRIVDANRPQTEEQWKNLMGDCTLPRDYFYSYLTGGCVGLMRAWFDNDLQEPPVQIAALADRLIAAARNL